MRAVVALACLALVGCGTGLREGELRIELPVIDVPPGDTFGCYFSDVLAEEPLVVVRATGAQRESGHHLALHWVEPPRPVGVVACDLADTTDWHFVLEARRVDEEAPAGATPDGHGVLVPEGAQLAIVTHHANADESPARALDVLSIDTVAQGSVALLDELAVRASPTVPAGGPHLSVTECALDGDVELSSLRAQLGPTGTRYTLERVTADDEVELLFEAAWEPGLVWHPPEAPIELGAPLVLGAGTRLRQTCEWLNETSEALTFPSERCEAVGRFVGDAPVACAP